MTENLLKEADQYLAQGDYVRALDELRKAGPVDPEVARRIHTALGRLKLVAAREFAVGRWSVAEGIFDAVSEHEQFLSDAERVECRNIVKDIERCRDEGRYVHVLIQAAAQLASENRYAQSREIALEAMRGCSDPHQVARLRHLLRSLPNPLGRLLYGFDSAVEVDQFVRTHAGARAEVVLNESHPLGGGFARMVFPSQGSRIDLMDPPTDWSDGKDLGFMVQLASKTRSTFRLTVGDLRNSWATDLSLMDFYWNQKRLTFDQFQKKGEPDWRAVTVFSITSLTPAPTAIHLDEVRLRGAPLGKS
ncbi:MAG TPA: hypothetical protein VNM14_10275 [Planctomycetota bacterium]|jgi:hypothetical protein|nr:hypothetical protein [Planctomycetota bacterium]